MRKKLMLAFLSVLLFMIPATAGAFRLEKVWKKSYPVAASPTLELHNVIGSIQVESGDRGSIEITAEIRIKAPSKSKAEHLYREIDFLVEGDSARVSVKAKLPPERQDRFLNVFFSEATSIRINYRVTVPRATALRLGTVNGDIEITGIEGAFDIKTDSGAITARLRGGGGKAATVNGSIDVAMEDFPAGALTLETTNGRITLALPEGTSAQLEAEAVNGGVSVHFPLAEKIEAGRGHLKAILGKGSGTINLETVNGDISLISLAR